MTMETMVKMMAILNCHQSIYYCNCFDNFLDAAKFPPRETTIAATMVT